MVGNKKDLHVFTKVLFRIQVQNEMKYGSESMLQQKKNLKTTLLFRRQQKQVPLPTSYKNKI